MKNIIVIVLRNILKIFFVFPIKKNRIIFVSYNGKQYSCNPKYIYEYLYSNKDENSDLEFIWAMNDTSNTNILGMPKIVKYKSLSYIYYTLTSKIVIENSESWSILPIRKNQVVINTWHGGGAYKRVGVNRVDGNSFNTKNVIYKNRRVDVYLSSSEYFSQTTLRESFKFDGKILNTGMPRNDLLVQNDDTKIASIKKKLNLDNKKIIIVAPTFRSKDQHDFHALDYKALLNSLSSRFGDEWVVLYRSHYYEDVENENNESIVDVSTYPDMQELLLISDILLTDFSSSMWDFSLMYKPVFLMSTDLEKYQATERDFYMPINKWPFSFANNFEELISTINEFTTDGYLAKVKDHHTELVSYDLGNASKQVCEFLTPIIDVKGRKQK